MAQTESPQTPAQEKIVKIKLLHDLPVDPKHKALGGNVYDAEDITGGGRGAVRFWIVGATGERVGVLDREAEAVEPSGKEGDYSPRINPGASTD